MRSGGRYVWRMKQKPSRVTPKAPSKTPLSARWATVLTLESLLQRGTALDQAFEQVLHTVRLSEVDRGFAYRLASETIRHKGNIEAILARCLHTPLNDTQQPVHYALMIGVTQLLLLDTPPHAAVNETVEAIAQSRFKAMKGLVNAILQRITREKEGFLLQMRDPKLRLPEWVRQRWIESYGDANMQTMSDLLVHKPPLDRVWKDAARISTKNHEIVLTPCTTRLLEHAAVNQLDGYEEGAWWVQDVASTQVVKALGEVNGKRVLDLCAAPGGKTAQLLSLGAEVTAVDSSSKRLSVLRENMQRLGFSPKVITADISKWKPDGASDAVLLDAPCSATGTFRKHPEVLWLKKPEDIARMATLQRECLDAVLRWLPEGVPLVYAVCSLEPEEGEGQIERLLKDYPSLALMPVTLDPVFLPCIQPNGTARLLPTQLMEQGGNDGFFIAKLVKS